MAIPIIIAVVILALIAGALVLVQRFGRERAAVQETLDQPETPTLDYVVPHGQDPAVVLAALSQHGVEATVHPGPTRQVVRISWDDPTPSRREEIRDIVASANETVIQESKPVDAGPVRFQDERR